tara:strand:- start:505 stop:1167 length:663 start_codon:yes stop_codon:yes gene_type:complete
MENKNLNAENELQYQYELVCKKNNDMTPYGPILHYIGTNVSSVIEMGIGPLSLGLNSTWCLLQGLYESPFTGDKKFISYDILEDPININIYDAQKVAIELGIDFKFMIADSGTVIIDKADLLFIDTEHTYQHLIKELRLHSPKIEKYILIHDTSAPYGNWEDWPFNHERRGELANSPEKYGLWPAVVDFLQENKEWKLNKRYEHNHGLTIIERVSNENNL